MAFSEISLHDWIRQQSHCPIVDVRSPLEFSRGHIPGAINIPLLDDSARALVGTAYKHQGKQEAVKMGFQLVGPRLAELVEQAASIACQRTLVVYCWRGGMRSAAFCQFMEVAGIQTRRLVGGYKAYRTLAGEMFCWPWKLLVLSGYTGSGKTALLGYLAQQGEQVIDLEALANHKGSAFGALGMPAQPTTEQFHNLLFDRLSALDPNKAVWIEDESVAIGRVFIPENFWKTMRKSPVFLCQIDQSIRVDRLVSEYGTADLGAFYSCLQKIARKLGGQHVKQASEWLADNNMRGVIEILLGYYDKAYLYSFQKRLPTVVYTLDWTGDNPRAAAEELVAHGAHL